MLLVMHTHSLSLRENVKTFYRVSIWLNAWSYQCSFISVYMGFIELSVLNPFFFFRISNSRQKIILYTIKDIN